MQQASWLPGKMTGACLLSRSGMMYMVDSIKQLATMETWLRKNTSTGWIATALFAGRRLGREIRGASNDAAQTLVAGRFRPEKQLVRAWFATRVLCRNDRCIKHAHENAERHFACLGARLIRWLRSESALLFFAVRLLQDACETKLIAQRIFWGIRLKTCGLTLSRILNLACLGIITERTLTHGA